MSYKMEMIKINSYLRAGLWCLLCLHWGTATLEIKVHKSIGYVTLVAMLGTIAKKIH